MAKKNRTDDLHDPTPATHGDLNIWGGQIQGDIRKLEKRVSELPTRNDLKQYATKADLERFAKQITDHIDTKIDAAVENRAADLLGVKKDEIREIQRKVKNQEERITALER